MWIPITLAAATFQIFRTARQHRLREVLTVNEAGFVRYAYGFPLALVAAFVTFGLVGRDLPAIPARFWPIIVAAGVAQILGTVALLRSFDLRDFAIGTVYAKTEVILVAVISALALGESLAIVGWIGVIICTIGVAWLAAPERLTDIVRSASDPAAVMGVGAGLGFASAAAGIRAASRSLGDGSTWDRALLTLTVMLAVQTALNGIQIARSSTASVGAVVAQWRAAVPVGILSLGGSACWAVAVTLTNAAKVRTLGQVEVVLAFAISTLWLGQRHTRLEYSASALVLVGVVTVVVFG